MTVNFKFDYVLNLHDRNKYINLIEKDGMKEEDAFNRSLIKVNKYDIKSINKSFNGLAIIMFKNNSSSIITTIEDYDEVIDVIQKANLALDIMSQERIYIFDEFEVDDDELNICEFWESMKNKK